jgi:hypothetical protein
VSKTNSQPAVNAKTPGGRTGAGARTRVHGAAFFIENAVFCLVQPCFAVDGLDLRDFFLNIFKIFCRKDRKNTRRSANMGARYHVLMVMQ